MNNQELFQWAEAHNFPQLVISQNDIVRPGRRSWFRLLNDPARMLEAIKRVEPFLARLESKKAVTNK